MTRSLATNDICLHLLMSAETSVTSACVGHSAPGDSIVLMGDAILLLADPAAFRDLVRKTADDDGPRLLALVADASARGLKHAAQSLGIPLVEDLAWAELVLGHKHCLSWK